MKILFCAEFYYPSVGGVQEVLRQLAERMASAGHDVSVASTRLPQRTSGTHNGVRVHEFSVTGNRVAGMQGELAEYCDFLQNGGFDIVMIYAAQQWTFDAAWEVLPSMTARKVLVPCGYSGQLDKAYAGYFEALPAVLKQFDALVYHATQYRDFAFGVEHGLTNAFVIPNGADEREFSVARDDGFRARNGIGQDDFLILTIGSLTGTKGHLELAQAFELVCFPGRPATLLLNGNHSGGHAAPASLSGVWRMLLGHARKSGWRITAKIVLARLLKRLGVETGWFSRLQKIMLRINASGSNKKVMLGNLPREELVQAYLNANLFVFASSIEYSPLVLFESSAAGLPFLSTAVGNAAEIAGWTGGGEVCEVTYDQRGFAHVDPVVLATRIESLVGAPDRLRDLGTAGRSAWRNRFNWQGLSDEYEQLFLGLQAGAARASAGVDKKQREDRS